MPPKRLLLDRHSIRPHCARIRPDFGHPSVLSADPWDFVALWLKRQHSPSAGFYWEQSRVLFNATGPLNPTASPITSYYACLNAAKALLSVHNHPVAAQHGVSGKRRSSRIALVNEEVTIQNAGVVPALATLLGLGNVAKTYTLHSLLHSLPFVHRAFVLTFTSADELFLPLDDVCFVQKLQSDESWLQAKVPRRYKSAALKASLPIGFEIDAGQVTECIARCKRRFQWSLRKHGRRTSVSNLQTYHSKIRKDIVPIVAGEPRWYLRKRQASMVNSPICPLISSFAAIHRLSELSRYDPLTLKRHLDARHGWLLVEFLKLAPAQFIYGIASEITSATFLRPMSVSL